MNLWTISLKSIRHYWRTHLGVWLGLILSSSVLTGALLVGDSVRYTLNRMALDRLGGAHFALVGNDRFFRASLAQAITESLHAPAAPVYLLEGSVSIPGGGAKRANHAQVIGVDSNFWPLADYLVDDERAWINQRTAAYLGVTTGDRILVRFPKPSALPRDAPLSEDENLTTALPFTVGGILSDDSIGRFSLQANQIPPYNVFLSMAVLQKALEQSDTANLILVGQNKEVSLTAENVREVINKKWALGDAQLSLVKVPEQPFWELRTDRIFLDEPIEQAVLGQFDDAMPILTYFVNEFKTGTNTTPYSMITAWPQVGGSNQISINTWLANDLKAKAGDDLSIKYFIMGPKRKPVEKEAAFKVHEIVPLAGLTGDRTLMPDFPGMKDSENCRDWRPGFQLDESLIQDEDEEYWDTHKGTPKAFISLAKGQALWQNRFGNLTSIRFPEANFSPDKLIAGLKAEIEPAAFGLQVQPVRELALNASGQAMPFDVLFLSFSFFIITAALLLSGMLFVFGLQQRAKETGTLLALGFTPAKIRNLMLREGLMLAISAAVIGGFLGVLFTKGILTGLATIWKDAVAAATLRYHATPLGLGLGACVSILLAIAVIFFILRKQVRQSVHQILVNQTVSTKKQNRRYGYFSLAALIYALMVLNTFWENPEAMAFFSAGSLLLLSGLAAVRYWLGASAASPITESFTSIRLTLLNMVRRRGRSLATIMLLACGAFIVISIEAHRLDALKDADQPTSGTGGYTFYSELTQPVLRDINDPKEQDFYGLDTNLFKQVSFVPFRVMPGDEASCLNLNRAQNPRLLGVNYEMLRGRFTFAKQHKDFSSADPWRMLKQKHPSGAIPAIGDQNSLQWALMKKIGQTLEYKDERGEPFQVVLVGGLASSVMQGNLIIDETAFTEKFPTASGYRSFLIDAEEGSARQVEEELASVFAYYGIDTSRAYARLQAFNDIQNTYLKIFQILGGLGLLLGSFGLGVVVLRNVLERRSELGLLRAVGFTRGKILRQLISEHGMLLLVGLLCGVLPAVITLIPAALTPGADLSFDRMAYTTLGIFLNGFVWTVLAALFALKGGLLASLRNE